MAKIGRSFPNVVTTICNALSDESITIQVIGILSDMGHAAKDAALPLCALLKSGDGTKRFWAAQALGAIGNKDEAVMAALTRALQDADRPVREMAAESLERLKK